MAFRRGTLRPARKIDYKQWTFMPAAATSVTADSTFLDAGFVSFLAPATILRCRGSIQVNFDQTVQAGDEMGLTFGLGIFSTDAINLGSTAMPDPGGEPDFPWLWWYDLWLHTDIAGGTALGNAWGQAVQRVNIDTKAMRKVKPGQGLALVVQATGSVGAPVVDVDFQRVRVLLGT